MTAPQRAGLTLPSVAATGTGMPPTLSLRETLPGLEVEDLA